MSEAEASKAMVEVDKDSDGTVDYVEFEEWNGGIVKTLSPRVE